MKIKIGMLLLLSLVISTVLTGCGSQENGQANTESAIESQGTSETDNNNSEEEVLSVNILIGDQGYEVALDDNDTKLYRLRYSTISGSAYRRSLRCRNQRFPHRCR